MFLVSRRFDGGYFDIIQCTYSFLIKKKSSFIYAFLQVCQFLFCASLVLPRNVCGTLKGRLFSLTNPNKTVLDRTVGKLETEIYSNVSRII